MKTKRVTFADLRTTEEERDHRPDRQWTSLRCLEAIVHREENQSFKRQETFAINGCDVGNV